MLTSLWVRGWMGIWLPWIQVGNYPVILGTVRYIAKTHAQNFAKMIRIFQKKLYVHINNQLAFISHCVAVNL